MRAAHAKLRKVRRQVTALGGFDCGVHDALKCPGTSTTYTRREDALPACPPALRIRRRSSARSAGHVDDEHAVVREVRAGVEEELAVVRFQGLYGRR